MIEKGRHRDAIEYLRQAVALNHSSAGPFKFRCALLKIPATGSRTDSLSASRNIKPNDPEIQHILMALTQNKIPDKAPANTLKIYSINMRIITISI